MDQTNCQLEDTMTALYRGPKKGYKLTEADTQMLAKSLWGENKREITEEAAGAVAWAMMYRYLLLDWKWMRAGWSFERFITEFSQPVNPDFRYADRPGCQRLPSHCTPDRLKKRQRIHAASWADIQRIRPKAAEYARAFQKGTLRNPFPAPVYNFASDAEIANQGRSEHAFSIGGNSFLPFESLKPDTQRAVLDGTVHTGTAAYKAAWAAVAFAALGAASAWLLDRYGDDIADFTKKNLKT